MRQKVSTQTIDGPFIFYLEDDVPHELCPYIGAWVSMLSDSSLGLKRRKIVSRFTRRLIQFYSDVSLEYKELYERLLHYVSNLDKGNNDGFDRRWLKTPVSWEILHYISNRDPIVLKFLNTFLNFGKYTKSSNPTGVKSLTADALRKWLGDEERLSRYVNPRFISSLRTILGLLFTDAPDYVPAPSHGSGRVAEVGIAYLHEKDRILSSSPSTSSALKPMYDSHKQWSLIDSVLPERADSSGEGSLYSRLRFVTKNMWAYRSMCPEPADKQFQQQSVRLWLEAILANGIAGRFVRLGDQSHNQLAAQAGSLYGHLDTIDCSRASDNIPYDLVMQIFPLNVARLLADSASSGVKMPNGEIFFAKKFAPMGSAVCFPVQCYVFLSVLLYAYYIHCYGELVVEPKKLNELLKLIRDDPFSVPVSGYATVRVYGDDLICDSRTTTLVIGLLKRLGLTVNVSKSFIGDHFYRESCGKHYAYGVDVSAVTLKVDATEKQLTPKLFASLIDAATRFHESGYRWTRNFLARYVARANRRHHVRVNPKPYPIAINSESGFGFRPSFKVRYKRQYVKEYGHDAATDPRIARYRSRIMTATIKREEGERDERYHYVLWFRTNLYLPTTQDRDWASSFPEKRVNALRGDIIDKVNKIDFIYIYD